MCILVIKWILQIKRNYFFLMWYYVAKDILRKLLKISDISSIAIVWSSIAIIANF